jgi:hypothetical protein
MVTLWTHALSFYIFTIFLIGFTIIGFVNKPHVIGWVFLAMILVTIVYYAIWLITRLYFKEENKNMFLKRSITIDNEGISLKTGERVISYRWEAYTGWWIFGGCYVIGGSSGKNTIFIPKTDIAESRIEEFEGFLKDKIDKIVEKKNVKAPASHP